jgi:hypothetical protein
MNRYVLNPLPAILFASTVAIATAAKPQNGSDYQGIATPNGVLKESLYIPCSTHRITADAYRRIRLGMKVREVKAILGEPRKPSDAELMEYVIHQCNSANSPIAEGDLFEHAPKHGDVVHEKYWFGESGVIAIGIDRGGRVVLKHFARFRPKTRP